jgi:hypothetical protein
MPGNLSLREAFRLLSGFAGNTPRQLFPSGTRADAVKNTACGRCAKNPVHAMSSIPESKFTPEQSRIITFMLEIVTCLPGRFYLAY